MIQNEGILDPKPRDPNGYVTKDLEWAAVSYGNKYVIVHNGQQVHTSNSYTDAKAYIEKQVKTKRKKATVNLEQFL